MDEQIIINLLDKSNEIKQTYQKIKAVQKEKFFQFPQMRTTEQIIYDYLRVMNRQIEELRAYLEGLGAGCDV